MGFVVTVVEFILHFYFGIIFDTNVAGMQFVQSFPLISSFGVNYLVGVDGVSLFLIIMITFYDNDCFNWFNRKKDVKI